MPKLYSLTDHKWYKRLVPDDATLFVQESLRSELFRITPDFLVRQYRAHVTNHEEIGRNRKTLELNVTRWLMQDGEGRREIAEPAEINGVRKRNMRRCTDRLRNMWR